MAESRKKVVVRRFEGEIVWGYLPQNGFVEEEEDSIEVLDVAGKVTKLILRDIKMISYVKDFNLDDKVDPERVGRRSFLGRPRGEGLWLKTVFLDGEVMEGTVHFDGFMDGLLRDRGFRMTPPDARSNTQMIFVPRSALAEVEVLGYVTAPGRKKAKDEVAKVVQPGLFGE
jgi:hypothetical protein